MFNKHQHDCCVSKAEPHTHTVKSSSVNVYINTAMNNSKCGEYSSPIHSKYLHTSATHKKYNYVTALDKISKQAVFILRNGRQQKNTYHRDAESARPVPSEQINLMNRIFWWIKNIQRIIPNKRLLWPGFLSEP